MKHVLAAGLLILLVAGSAFAHAGHVHPVMGTVTMLHSDGSFMMKTTAGKEITVQTATTTAYVFSDDRPASRDDLKKGMRVIVRLAADKVTAANVKMSRP